MPRAINSFHQPRTEQSELVKNEDSLLQEAKGKIIEHLSSHLSGEQTQGAANLFAIDVTPKKRPYAKKLKDRGFVHCNEPVPGKKPVTLGHEYSCVAFLPQKNSKWALPLSIERVTTTEKGPLVGIKLWADIIQNKALGFQKQLCVGVGDCAYSSIKALYAASKVSGAVFITRLSKNRSLLRPYELPQPKKKHGRYKHYDRGNPFKLEKPETWGDPEKSIEIIWETKKGKTNTVKIDCWCNLRTRGEKERPMHDVPLTVVRITVKDINGKNLYSNVLWLVVIGNWKDTLSLKLLWSYYRARFDIEHFFKFGKLHLLLGAYQTPNTESEENWMQFVILAHHQLYHARHDARNLPKPWEKKDKSVGELSPSRVQRDMPRLLDLVGTVANKVKPRGIPQGRKAGEVIAGRPDQEIVKKSQPQPSEKPRVVINWTLDNQRKPNKPLIKYNGIDFESLPQCMQKIISTIKPAAPLSTGPPV